MKISQITSIAQVYVRGAFRSHLFTGLVFGVLVLFLGLFLLQFLVTGAAGHIIQTGSFWIMGIWGLICALTLGLHSISQEIKNKTHFMILSRPVQRSAFVLGKFGGIFLVMGVVFCLSCLLWLAMMKIGGVEITAKHGVALGFILVEWWVLAGFSLFFACFTSPIFHGIFMVGIYHLGHWSDALAFFADRIESEVGQGVLTGLHLLFPNLESLNFRAQAVYHLAFADGALLHALAVGLGWASFMVVLSMVIFNRRRLM